MKIIEDCWDEISTFNCQYGAHVFEGSRAKIYVNHWLSVSREIYKGFYQKNDEGFVGNCLLVFDDVKNFEFSITQHSVQDGKVRLHEPIVFRYQGLTEETTTRYEFEGSLHGFPSSVSIAIEAKRFSLHVYDKDEPAREA
jgi:hypothetical protein